MVVYVPDGFFLKCEPFVLSSRVRGLVLHRLVFADISCGLCAFSDQQRQQPDRITLR